MDEEDTTLHNFTLVFIPPWFYVFSLSVRPILVNIVFVSRTSLGNCFKFGTNIYWDSKMNCSLVKGQSELTGLDKKLEWGCSDWWRPTTTGWGFILLLTNVMNVKITLTDFVLHMNTTSPLGHRDIQNESPLVAAGGAVVQFKPFVLSVTSQFFLLLS